MSACRPLAFGTLGSVSAVEMQFEDPDERKQIMESAAALGARMVRAIENRETIPEQEEELIRLMRHTNT